jgi:hypothetical protein
MYAFKNGWLIAASLAVSPLFPIGQTHATAFAVTLDSALLNGSAAVLAFDFIGGGVPQSTVNLSAVASNAIQPSNSRTGIATRMNAPGGSDGFFEFDLTGHRFPGPERFHAERSSLLDSSFTASCAGSACKRFALRRNSRTLNTQTDATWTSNTFSVVRDVTHGNTVM